MLSKATRTKGENRTALGAVKGRLASSVLFAVAVALPLLAGEPPPSAPALREAATRVDAGLTWTSGTYRYDGVGNIVAIGTAAAPGTHGARTYGYDAMGRLTRAQHGSAAGLPPVTDEYQYDPYGNRTAYAVNQQWVSVPADPVSNRLLDAVYDVSGNQLTRGATSATYDGFGMMTSYRFDAVNGEAFVYNANDERIGVLRGDDWTWSFRDAHHRVLRQYRSSAANPSAPWLWLEDFVYRGAALLGAERVAAEGGHRNYHLDHLGSPRLVTSASGAVVAEHDFRPFGEERTAIAQLRARGFDRESPHRFTGHERDFDSVAPNDSSGYVDSMHARYYAAKTGRFSSVDPGRDWDLEQPQSWNMYAYVRNNPVRLTDSTGRQIDLDYYGFDTRETFDAGRGAIEWSIGRGRDCTLCAKLPNDPTSLDDRWKIDEGHKNPNGKLFRDPDGNVLEWHQGQKGKRGWRGRDHWHYRPDGEGGDEHLVAGDEVPDPSGSPFTSITTGDVWKGVGLAIFGTAITLLTGGNAALQPSPAGVVVVPRTFDPRGFDRECPYCI